ncbi:UNVERIFIED_CONTAM: hypothetical protein Sindi_1715500 [Sesamum indicum]
MVIFLSNHMIEYPSRLISPGQTLPKDYYSTKKLVKDFNLPVEKIDACKNGCMLYWKDDVDLEYCKFCGDARYKPIRGRHPCRKKSQYAILRYLPLTSRLQRLYSSRVTAKYMMWHAAHQKNKEPMCIHPILQKSHIDWSFAQTILSLTVMSNRCVLEIADRRTIAVVACGCSNIRNATDNEFIMRAALMWIVNDLPTCEMAFGWSTTSVMVELHEQQAPEMSLLGPSAELTSIPCYFVSGYNFQMECHNANNSTMNYGVCIKSSSYTDDDNDFFGIIEGIVQLTYLFIPDLHNILFKCHWVDPVRAKKVHPHYHLVDGNFKWGQSKTKARRVVDASKWTEISYQPEDLYQSLKLLRTNTRTICMIPLVYKLWSIFWLHISKVQVLHGLKLVKLIMKMKRMMKTASRTTRLTRMNRKLHNIYESGFIVELGYTKSVFAFTPRMARALKAASSAASNVPIHRLSFNYGSLQQQTKDREVKKRGY